MTGVKSGTIKIFAGDLPTFMYDDVVEFDAGAPEVGLLEGHLPIRVCFLFAISHSYII